MRVEVVVRATVRVELSTEHSTDPFASKVSSVVCLYNTLSANTILIRVLIKRVLLCSSTHLYLTLKQKSFDSVRT